MHNPQPFEILKMDRRRGNIVVSRRTVLEESRAEQRSEIVQNLEEGQVVEGVVKNITDYGAFVDLGGIDGLLHVTDMAWRRVNHPTEILNIGQTVKVQIIRINQETHRISLGMKQLESDPWDDIGAKFPIGKKITGTVTNITDYGAFVELEPGIEGLIHVSEMSWTKKNVHPGKILSTTQEVDVVVLEVDPAKRRISLGLKQTLENPWEAFARNHPVGSVVEGEVKNKTEFGLFIGLDGDVDGMVHLSDLDWNRPGEQVIEEYNKGDMVKAQVLDVDVEKERISLGIKQLGADAVGEAATSGELRKNAVVTCEVTGDQGWRHRRAPGRSRTSRRFIKRSDLSRDRDEQRPERFPSARRSMPASSPSTRRPARSAGLDQGAGNRRREGSGRPVRFDRLRRFARRHPRRRAEEVRQLSQASAAPLSTALPTVIKETRRIAPAGFFIEGSPPSCGIDPGDVDLLHLHHRLERPLRLRAAGGHRLGQGARRDLPGNAPLVLAPAAFAFLAAIADDGVPVAVGLLLIVGGDLEGKRLAVREHGSAIEADAGNAAHGEVDRQHVALLARGIVARRAKHGLHDAVGKQRCVEARRLLGILLVPQADRVLGNGHGPILSLPFDGFPAAFPMRRSR